MRLSRSAAAAAMIAALIAGYSPAQVNRAVDRSGRYPVTRVSGEAPRWRLDSIATLSDSGVGFRDVKGILIDPRGGVLVLDRKAPAIYRFSDDGKLRGILGRVGSGPKEYQSPNAISWAGDDLLVFDPGNGRVVRWNREGEWVAQWTHSRLTGEVPMYTAGLSSAWLLGVVPGPDGKLMRTFNRLPPQGSGDTIHAPRAPAGVVRGVDCTVGFNGTISVFGSPFSSGIFSVRPTPDGNLVELSGPRYRIATKTPAGDTLRVLERTLPPVAISDAEWADSTSEYRAFKAKNPLAGCTGSITRPDRKPEAVDMTIDDRGRIWVERTMPKGTLLEIWDGDQLVGSVPGLQRRRGTSDAIDIRGDRLAIARRNLDDDGTIVVVFRIVPR